MKGALLDDSDGASAKGPRTVIAFVGLGCENSTFTTLRTEAAGFYPKRGDELFKNMDKHPQTQLGQAADWRGALTGHTPRLDVLSVTRKAFKSLVAEILDQLETPKLDGVWLDNHG